MLSFRKTVKNFQGNVTRDDLERRFSTQQRVAMLQQCGNHSKQCRNNAVKLCCAKNHCCESSHVTSPLGYVHTHRIVLAPARKTLIPYWTSVHTWGRWFRRDFCDEAQIRLASHAGVFRGACFSSLSTVCGDGWKTAPLKTSAWVAKIRRAISTFKVESHISIFITSSWVGFITYPIDFRVGAKSYIRRSANMASVCREI